MIPLRFPNDAEKIHREALAFRRLSPTERVLAILDLIASGATLLSQSPSRQAAEKFRQEQKALHARPKRSSSRVMASDLPTLPQHLHQGLQELVHALDKHGLRYTLIGGLAAGFRGRPRFTQDVDFLLEVPQLVLPALLDDLRERGFSFDTETAIREWTREHMTVLDFHGVQIDWLKPVVPLYQRVIDSARSEEWLGTCLKIASTEGLILTKLISFRTQDQADIESLLASNRGQLDVDLIRREWLTVGTVNEPRMQRFEEMVRLYYLTSPETPPTTGANP